MIKINGLDHLVLTVRDIEATCKFYSEILGMEVVVSANKRRALSFGSQVIHLHEKGAEFTPKTHLPTPGSADPCFIAATPLPGIIHFLAEHGVAIVTGPVA